MRTILSIMCALCLAVGTAFASDLTVKKHTKSGLGTYYEIELPKGKVFVAGQPTQAGLKQVKTLGVATVVNLRLPHEKTFDEKKILQTMGLDYLALPMSAQSVKPKTLKGFEQVLDDPEAYPVYVHCARGARAALMVALYQIIDLNMKPGTVIKQSKEYGLKDPQVLKKILDKHATPKDLAF